MAAIVIMVDNQNTRILRASAKKPGANVLNINEEQFEDLAHGTLTDRIRKGKTVSRESIMKILDSK